MYLQLENLFFENEIHFYRMLFSGSQGMARWNIK
jgi:hypothetical protein